METRKSDPAYNTAARDDFAAMIDVDRYATRSSHFEEIIAGLMNTFGTRKIRTISTTWWHRPTSSAP